MSFTSIHTSLRNTWRIACRSNAVANRKTTSTQVFEHKIVLFRDKWGRVTGLKDFDANSGMPLSLGLNNPRTRTIESLYDKWRYDSDGKCISIPTIGTEGIPDNLRIPKYHTFESDGYIWVWMGKDKPTGEPTSISGIEHYVWNQQTQIIDADPTLCLKHEIDWPSSLVLGRMNWAFRRSVIPLMKPVMLDQPFEVRATETGFEMFQNPPTKRKDKTLAIEPVGDVLPEKPRNAKVSVFSLPDRVVHQKLIKRPFWKGFGDWMSISHFVPIIDPISGKISTRAEYMWTPYILPGYAFQRNKLTTLDPRLPLALPSYRKTDKVLLETLQKNLNHHAALSKLNVEPSHVDTEVPDVATQRATELVASDVQPAFGPNVPFDNPSMALETILDLASKDKWNREAAEQLIPGGRHLGTFRVTNPDS